MFHQTSTSPVQFAIGLLSVLLFAVAVVEKRARMRRTQERPTRRSWLSLVGIIVQSFGYLVVSAGRVAPTADPLALASTVYSLVALCAGIGSVLLFRASARALGENWSVVARMRTGHSLVTNGPFSRIRHPIYLAMLLLLIAWGVGLGHLLALIPGVPLLLIGTAIRVHEEEKLLIGQFGDDYRAYARSTRAFIPRLL
ncbi:MAG TPA: isoprenylcysteine carboxylmethyltransferase family protein [Sphingomicrobium sp.]|nr:isoprenylcysteine carboxylmethyltransferase family protein [Sphingomicrobium sp.]